jgi:hypothetical protein
VEPLVSILIPAYNAERWIADTLRSALAQSWPRMEIIVVDDGSRDRTLAVARQFASKNVAVVSQKNAGAAAARNNALSRSQGEYIQWLDADDLLARDKIERQIEVFKRTGNNRLLLSGPWGSFIYRPAKAKFRRTALWQDLPSVEWLTLQMGENLHMQTATWLVSRELTEAAGPWDERLASCASDDGEYFCRVILASEGIRFVPEAKMFYRMPTGTNLSYIGLSNRKMDVQLLALQLYIDHVRAREDSERVRSACVQFVQTWMPNFYPNRLDLVEKAEALAQSLGGELKVPRLGWKYGWIQKLFGWGIARRASICVPRLRWNVVRLWDRACYSLENRH